MLHDSLLYKAQRACTKVILRCTSGFRRRHLECIDFLTHSFARFFVPTVMTRKTVHVNAEPRGYHDQRVKADQAEIFTEKLELMTPVMRR